MSAIPKDDRVRLHHMLDAAVEPIHEGDDSTEVRKVKETPVRISEKRRRKTRD